MPPSILQLSWDIVSISPPPNPLLHPKDPGLLLPDPPLMAELKIPLIGRVPRAMNRQGNRRTTKEGSSDLKFQNFSLPKNRSWPRISTATGQYQTISEPLLECERNLATVLDDNKGCRNEDYEDPELHTVQSWWSGKLSAARPVKESEYADTRYFEGIIETPFSFYTKTSISMEGQAWKSQMRLEEMNKPISQDFGGQHVKGNKPMRGIKERTPLPPPRPPVTLSKRYQPLPPEPDSSGPPFPLRHSIPEGRQGSSQINLKNLSEVLGPDKVPQLQMKSESPHPSQNQYAQEIPLLAASSSLMMCNQTVQNRGRSTAAPREPAQPLPPPRCQPPGSLRPPEGPLSWRKPGPRRADGKDALHSEWYIGEHSRQAVEEALMKENKDGTFLVRDCSAKSRAEPYVLAVFYGNKVYNVKIRFLELSQQFALGTGLWGEEKFNSVEDIIEHYKHSPIILIDGKDKTGVHREQCYLTQPLPLRRHFLPW
ncbi:cytokine-dependent hematopoietic cell linker [Sorex araneus]|uniref:cytokine-dependent hematopoietic cell linker n=1 Tax=Sorex araneus TaxID=42254 RepID=UPI002433D71B|nr:cytokine-dependent hematopoietic cell linker [Sorex araneus]